MTLNCMAPVAQWIERWTSNPKAAGSSPAGGFYFIFIKIKYNHFIGVILPIFFTKLKIGDDFFLFFNILFINIFKIEK